MQKSVWSLKETAVSAWRSIEIGERSDLEAEAELRSRFAWSGGSCSDLGKIDVGFEFCFPNNVRTIFTDVRILYHMLEIHRVKVVRGWFIETTCNTYPVKRALYTEWEEAVMNSIVVL